MQPTGSGFANSGVESGSLVRRIPQTVTAKKRGGFGKVENGVLYPRVWGPGLPEGLK